MNIEKTFGGFFQSYIDLSGVPQELCSAELQSMQIDVKRRVIRIVLFSPKLLKRADLLRAQDLVAACKALQISSAQIQPH